MLLTFYIVMATAKKIIASIDDVNAGHINVKQKNNEYVFEYPCESSINCTYYKLQIRPGVYLFELWGAQGGDARYWNNETIRQNSGGKGAYVSGILSLSRTSLFYLYIGGKGEDQSSTEKAAYALGGYNGGGRGGADLHDLFEGESSAGGGGSTDIRLMTDDEDLLMSLKSRIIVAGGGGGGCSVESVMCMEPNASIGKFLCTYIRPMRGSPTIFTDYHGGPAGTFYGYTYNNLTFPGTQNSGSFGKGSDGIDIETGLGGSIGGGGSGYYGGTTVSKEMFSDQYVEIGGAGGSSYISGMLGCDSVSLLPKDKIIHTGNPYHYSGYLFSSPKMLSGLEYMYDPYGKQVLGHSGNGCAKITFLDSYPCTKPLKRLEYPQINSIII